MSDNHVTRLSLDDREIILIGTAHVSKKSAEQVREVIENERPDYVCVELDEQRYQALTDNKRWKEMDIFKIIKAKQSTFLLVSLIISSFQKRLARQFGIQPGLEMLQGIRSAQAVGANLVMADRNIQVTFSRIWRGLGLWGKLKLMLSIFFSIFNDEEFTEEELEKMKSQDMLNAMLEDFTASFPDLKRTLVDERDQYIAQKIRETPGKKVVAVLGAAHVPGVSEEIYREHDLALLSQVPPRSRVPVLIAWAIPVIIVGIIAYTFYINPVAGINQSISWILWNGSFSALAATIAGGHPLTIATAFVVAPLSSLNPLMAAGWFAGIVQAYVRRPNVQDFENLAQDVFTVKGFWSNKVTRILLIVALTNLGSTIGTMIGGADVIRLFLQNL